MMILDFNLPFLANYPRILAFRNFRVRATRTRDRNCLFVYNDRCDRASNFLTLFSGLVNFLKRCASLLLQSLIKIEPGVVPNIRGGVLFQIFVFLEPLN